MCCLASCGGKTTSTTVTNDSVSVDTMVVDTVTVDSTAITVDSICRISSNELKALRKKPIR